MCLVAGNTVPTHYAIRETYRRSAMIDAIWLWDGGRDLLEHRGPIGLTEKTIRIALSISTMR